MPARPELPTHFTALAPVDGVEGRLRRIERPMPSLGPGQTRLRVLTCGVCRTDLHLLDGDLPTPRLPLVPGHEIVGEVVEQVSGRPRFALGARVGVPWLFDTCQACRFCTGGRENLCESARFTGWSVDGGYAEYAVANDDYLVEIPPAYGDEQAAPLLCAGLVGYRALSMLPGAAVLGIFGFGTAGHLIAQVALDEGRRAFAFTRPGDAEAQALAGSLGVAWAGDSTQVPPQALEGAILFAPAGELVPRALELSAPGATVVCAGIHMSDIPSFPYRVLWKERCVRSVVSLTHQDGHTFMAWAGKHPLAPEHPPVPAGAGQRGPGRPARWPHPGRSGAALRGLKAAAMNPRRHTPC
jgi:propanol-preferring alcohol dehydrogenase